jgi:hypothetical protein
VKVTPKEQPNEPKPKEKEVLQIYVDWNMVILFNDGVSGSHCAEILEKLWPVLSAKNCKIVGLSSVYKTNYGTSEGSLMIDADEPLPIKYVKSSHQDAGFESFLAANKSQVDVDNTFNNTGGLMAALLMEAEMTGKPAISFKAIFDEHFITLESLRAY